VHLALMREMGTPRHEGFDPMPPRQHAAFLDRRESEESRVIAWVWSKTIHPGKGNRRSHYARDHRADPLQQKHIAADLNMLPSNVSSALKRLVERGRVRIDDNGRICLRGDVPDPEVRLMGTDNKDEGGVILQNNSIRDFLVYLQQHPEKETRQRGVAALHAAAKLAKRVKADAMAAARDIEEQIHSDVFKAFGYVAPESRAGRPTKDTGKRTVHLSLTEQLSFLYETPDGNYVQTENGYSVHAQNGDVQNSASLLSFSESSEFSETSSSDLAPVRAALDHYGRADDDAARLMVAKCRAKDADATAEEIAGVIREKGDANMHAGRKRVLNPIGFLLEVVPKCFPLTRKPPPPAAPPVDVRIATLENLVREMPPTHPQLSDFRAELDALRAEQNGRAKGAHA
jgi:hypothetical protein